MLVLIFLGLLISSVVGMIIASNKRVSVFAGFLLGLFLGPIGLVITALLDPPSHTIDESTLDPSSDFDLGNARYRLFLTERYGVIKNDILNEYIVSDKGFGDISSALDYCHEKYMEERSRFEITDDESFDKYSSNSDNTHLIILGSLFVICLILFFTFGEL